MDRFTLLITCFCMVSFTQNADAQLFPRRTRAPRVCCFKSTYNYNDNRLSNPVTATTFGPLPPVVTPKFVSSETSDVQKYPPRDVKNFTLKALQIENGPCRVSDVAVTVRRDGTWTLNCKAEQNPNIVPPQYRPVAMQFVRNRIQLTIRPYTDYQLAQNIESEHLGKTAVDSIDVPLAWLDRFQIRNDVQGGRSDRIKDNFDLINRLEIDLQFE